MAPLVNLVMAEPFATFDVAILLTSDPRSMVLPFYYRPLVCPPYLI